MGTRRSILRKLPGLFAATALLPLHASAQAAPGAWHLRPDFPIPAGWASWTMTATVAYLLRSTRKGGRIDGFPMSSGRVRAVRFERIGPRP